MRTGRESLALEEQTMAEEYWKDLTALPIKDSARLTLDQTMSSHTIEAENLRVKEKMDVSNLLNHSKNVDENPTHNGALNHPTALMDISNNVSERGDEFVPAGLPDCIFCPQTFDLHCKLAEHLVLDHGYPKLECPHCNFKCAKVVNMKRHIKCAHNMALGRYHCYACAFSSCSELATKNHVRTQHSRCPYCQNGFERLSAHERGCAMHPKHTNMSYYFKYHDRLIPK